MIGALVTDADRIEAAREAAATLAESLADRLPAGHELYVDSLGAITWRDPELDPRTNPAKAGISGGPDTARRAPGASGPSFAELDRLRPRPWGGDAPPARRWA
jgi:hypothetical protein